jgi:hypothetical protein
MQTHKKLSDGQAQQASYLAENLAQSILSENTTT